MELFEGKGIFRSIQQFNKQNYNSFQITLFSVDEILRLLTFINL